MSFELNIPKANGEPLNLLVEVGEVLFVLGANGTGKSSLMHHLYSKYTGAARRISAHRQTWFDSNFVSINAEQKRSTTDNMRNYDVGVDSRYRDPYSSQRPNIAIYDLIDAENVRSRRIAGAVDANDIELAQVLSKKDAPIKIINELLRLSNLPIQISVLEGEQVVATKSGGSHYSIAQLSDGERNALLVAADVLTATSGTLILIDEPERHLHRAIISPLLTLLFEMRTDCSFVVSTHEVMLPLDNRSARTLLLRSCTFSGVSISGWEADLVEPDVGISDDIRQDILGGRRKILFVEGDEQSLDKPLYSLIFPSVSVIAKLSCRDVENAVVGIRGASDLHWLKAFGVVDKDGRTQTDIDGLKRKGVYALSVFSVESIYYHPDIQRRVAERHALVTGEDSSTRLLNAKNSALSAVIPHINRLSQRAVEKSVREKILSKLPGRPEIAAGTPFNVSVDIGADVADESARLQDSIANGNLEEIIERYPVRETSALAEIARNLGFQSRAQYESTVRKLLIDDQEALAAVKSFFDSLPTDLETI